MIQMRIGPCFQVGWLEGTTPLQDMESMACIGYTVWIFQGRCSLKEKTQYFLLNQGAMDPSKESCTTIFALKLLRLTKLG